MTTKYNNCDKKIVDFIRILMYNIFEVVRMPMNSREMIRFLKRNGFTEIKGGKGSHDLRISIPVR